MSHFCVFVFQNPDSCLTVDDLLAPYCEQDEAYFEFQPAPETMEELVKTYDEVREKYSYKTFDDYMEQYHGYTEKDGVWGYMCNPNARWDWWQEGGRWGLERIALPENPTAKDISLAPDREAAEKASRFWDVYVEGNPLAAGEEKSDFDSFWKPEYYRDKYGTKEAYVEYMSVEVPYAFVTSDGEWCEVGRMGWWACDDATAESRAAFMKAYKEYVGEHPDELVTVVDCHI